MEDSKQSKMVAGELSVAKSGGMRKAGIAVGSIGLLVMKDGIDLRLAAIVGVIAVVGIICQTLLDSGIVQGVVDRWQLRTLEACKTLAKQEKAT